MHLLLLPCLALVLAGPARGATGYTERPGPFTVAMLEQTWHDASRDRDVPVKIYYPKGTDGDERATFPVIIFSHGLGGSREGYGYLGEHWASCGYISVHVQHHGSDGELLHGKRPLLAMRAAAANPTAATDRPKDITFAIDRLTALNAETSFPLHGRLDLARLGVAGHSFGAFTTMASAGARIPVLGSEPRFQDRRVKAAIAMSTPSNPGYHTDAAFDAVRIPVFHMTGTKDGSNGDGLGGGAEAIVGNTKAADRLLPYQHTRQAPAYLLVFTGGDHMVFSGRMTGTRATDKEFQARILSGSTAFWDAWLRDDEAAKAWLEDGGFSHTLGSLGTFEHKAPGQP